MIKQALNLVIPQYIVICQCLADQLFVSAFGVGNFNFSNIVRCLQSLRNLHQCYKINVKEKYLFNIAME